MTEDRIPEHVVRWLNGDRDPHTVRAMERWRSKGNDLRELEIVWSETTAATSPVDWALLRARLPDRRMARSSGGTRIRFARRRSLARAAAVFLIATGMGAAGLRVYQWARSVPAPVTIQVPAASRVALSLPGGIEAIVKPGSTLTFDAGRAGGPIRLEGAAFFKVEPDSSRIVEIITALGEVRNVGTEFTVSDFDGALSVSVRSGTVELTAGRTRALVRAGEQGVIRPGQEPVVWAMDARIDPFAWTRGVLLFHDETLNAVSRELERFYGTQIRVAPSAGRTRVSAEFSAHTQESTAIRAICQVVDLPCRRSDDGWTIGAL